MERIEILHKQLASLDMDVKDLSWTGPEPTRLTYNRLVENGDEEDPEARWSGRGPHSTLDRWGEWWWCWMYLSDVCEEMGIRRLCLERELKALDLDPKVLVLDEKVRNV